MALLFPARNGRRNGAKEKRTRRTVGLRLALVRSSRLAGGNAGAGSAAAAGGLLARCTREWLEQSARRVDGRRRGRSGGRASGRLSAAARLESGEREERGSEGERD